MVTSRSLSAVEQEVSQRLSRAFGHLPASDFTALVQRVAQLQWKYDRRKGVDGRPPRLQAPSFRATGYD